MTQTVRFPIVGAHFRPPAKGVLTALPLNCPLLLVPEPSNPYDPNAIQVLVDFSAQSDEVLADVAREIEPYGYTMDELPEMLHLGSIPAKEAKNIQLAKPIPATLSSTLSGSWAVAFTLTAEQEA